MSSTIRFLNKNFVLYKTGTVCAEALNLVHNLDGDVLTVSQTPEKLEHLLRHHSVLVVLCQPGQSINQ
jgi:hypothetical protein